MVRVLREWVLARSAPASPLARACALHLLCRDAGFLHDAGMKMAGLRVLLGDAACCCACARAIQLHTARSAPARPLARSCALICSA